MAINLKNLDSTGGFSIGDSTIVDSDSNIKNVNTLEVRNSHYTDSHSQHFILRGLNTATLSLDTSSTTIFIPSNTISFITANVVAVAEAGNGVLAMKLETAVSASSGGTLTELSTMETIIRDDVPAAESWSITPFTTGALNRFSYNTVKSGSNIAVKWFVYVQVASIDWS